MLSRASSAFRLTRSRTSHLLRAEVSVEDLQLVLSMVNGALDGIAAADERAATAARALEIALRGLCAEEQR